jgi:hypothetical protein
LSELTKNIRVSAWGFEICGMEHTNSQLEPMVLVGVESSRRMLALLVNIRVEHGTLPYTERMNHNGTEGSYLPGDVASL